MSRIAITLLLALGACAIRNVSGTELGGVVEYNTNSADAMSAAVAHCQKYGKTAKPTQVDAWGYLTFSCEAPRS